VQDTLERAISRSHQFDKTRDLRPWLFRILRNLNISQFRRAQRRGVHLPLDAAPDAALATPPAHDSDMAVRDISKALELLPFEQREVLVLVALEGMKYREVGDVLNIPIGTVMSRLSRARERLLELLQYPVQPPLRRVK
jgi:RNA polymerase sigma-70 factor (ECF subfamily)